MNRISEITRRHLIDELLMLNITGRLNLIDFLKRIWNLGTLPSTDRRFSNAEGDIWQHTINNSDWSDQYLYYDYLELLTCDDNLFLLFLEQVVHPAVREDKNGQTKYVEMINKYIVNDGLKLQIEGEMSGFPIYKAMHLDPGVRGSAKNLIFAADGPKPEIVLSDSINNHIEIVKNSEYCLVYDRSISSSGLAWKELVAWWGNTLNSELSDIELHRSLYFRLFSCLDSKPEKQLFRTFYRLFANVIFDSNVPALIPQVYLHYDPYTFKELHAQKRLSRQRMDFLILFSSRERVVIEVDGIQHYSNNNQADVKKYSEMVAADRELRLNGYEIYRFGGYEFQTTEYETILSNFFIKLFKKHGVELDYNALSLSARKELLL